MSNTTTGATPSIAVLIPAAGSGTRMGPGANKVLLPLGSTLVISHTVSLFQEHPAIGRIAVIAKREDFATLDRCFQERERWSKLAPWVEGGADRQESVQRGMRFLESDPPHWVLVHDGARPLCGASLVDRILAALERHAAVVPTLPITDTVRRISADGSSVVDRSGLSRTQTPQGFHWTLLAEAHQRASRHDTAATDDAQLIEAMGGSVAGVAGAERNLKITVAGDLELAEWILANPAWGDGKG